MQSKLIISFSIVSNLCLAQQQQQQQLSNTMVFNNSNYSVQILSSNSRDNFINSNVPNNRRNSNVSIQSNKIKTNQVSLNNQRSVSNSVKQNNKTNTKNVVRSRNRTNGVSVNGPNRSNLANLSVNDNNVNANDDSNFGNQFNNQQLLIENNTNPIQSQQSVNEVEQNNKVVQNVNTTKAINMSLNLNVRSFSSSSSSSSSKTHRHTFSKKIKKFERHFFGKIGSHKKSKHLVDVCFNWSK